MSASVPGSRQTKLLVGTIEIESAIVNDAVASHPASRQHSKLHYSSRQPAINSRTPPIDSPNTSAPVSTLADSGRPSRLGGAQRPFGVNNASTQLLRSALHLPSIPIRLPAPPPLRHPTQTMVPRRTTPHSSPDRQNSPRSSSLDVPPPLSRPSASHPPQIFLLAQ